MSSEDPKAKVVVLAVNTTWNLINFRAGLIRALLGLGYRVVALAPWDRHAQRVTDLGCELIHLPMDSQGTNPFRDAVLAVRFARQLRRLRANVFLGFTIKPNIYGSLAAGLVGVPVINNISGLGSAFLRSGPLAATVRALYRISLRRSHCVFFQNPDDLELFRSRGMAPSRRLSLLPGSGVDLVHFAAVPTDSLPGEPLKVLLVARLLWDKGVGEYIEALRQLRALGVAIDARVLGSLDAGNPSAISRSQIRDWVEEGLVSYLGETEDVRPYLANADVVVLPSYREGTPRSLLEAAAVGRPIITTDAPGCREVVRHGVNGYLVPVKDSNALAAALKQMSEASPETRRAFGAASRRLAEEVYDEGKVIRAYAAQLQAVFGGTSARDQ